MTEAKRSYYRLFSAYVSASLGAGVAVVALSLLVFEMVGDEQSAAAVIGAALSIKTLAYVVGAPLASAVLGSVPGRPLMIGLQLMRAGAIVLLPLVTEVWHLYALIGAFTLASAAFTPAYQAAVPALLTHPDDYARSLSRSRVAGEVEGMASPLIVAALLAATSVRGVFVAAMAAFLLAAALIAAARVPLCATPAGAGERLRRGFAALVAERPLRGLVPLAFAAGAGAAVTMVETVPIVRGRLGLGAEEAALALAVCGGGAVAGALALAPLLRVVPARAAMLAGGALVAAALAGAVAVKLFSTLLLLWAVIGFATALVQAPALAAIREAVAPEYRQAVYGANVSLTTAAAGLCFAATGALGGAASLPEATTAMAATAAVATAIAAMLWRPARAASAPRG